MKGQLDWKQSEIIWKPVLGFWISGFGKIKKKKITQHNHVVIVS